MTRSRLATAILLFLALLLVGACAGAGRDVRGAGETSGANAAGADMAEEDLAPADDALEAGAQESTRSGADLDSTNRPRSSVVSQLQVSPRYVIRKAVVVIRARDVGAALDRSRSIVTAAEGLIADESTRANRRGAPRRSTLTIRVPVDSFEQVIADLSALGTLESLAQNSEDVSGEVIDVDSRVTSAEASIRRIRILLDRAADLGDVIRLESELSERQADLESLQAQRTYLADQTSLSTITLTLLSPSAPPPAPEEPEEAGFLTGLKAGWSALLTFLTGLVTVFGALLPFAVLLLLLGIPALVLVRRHLARRPAQEPTG